MALEFISEFIAVIFIIISYFYTRLKIANAINPIFLKKKLNWLYICICYIGIPFIHIGPIGYLVFYYIVFRYQVKKDSRYALFYSLYAFLAYESVYYFFISLAYRFVDSSQWIMFYKEGFRTVVCLLVLAVALAIHHLIGLNQKIIESEEFLPIIKKTTDYFIGLVGIRFLSIFAYQVFRNEYLEIKVTASLSIFIVTLLVMLYLRDQQLKYLHQKIVQQKEEEIRGANHMVDELATLYNEVRGFRHDFGGIMSTMDSAIKAQDIEEVTKIYESVFEKMHQQISSSYYSGFNLGKIKEIGFRGVIANKMIQAKNNGIPFRLEVMQEVPPVNAPLLETVRILTILLDNALEATINARNPEVTLSLLVKNNQVVMIVKNTRDQKILIDGQKIWQRGYSTKGYNRGQGLANLSEICADLDSIDIETHISNSHFTQTIFFETRC